jgi:hypothetical protein
MHADGLGEFAEADPIRKPRSQQLLGRAQPRRRLTRQALDASLTSGRCEQLEREPLRGKRRRRVLCAQLAREPPCEPDELAAAQLDEVVEAARDRVGGVLRPDDHDPRAVGAEAGAVRCADRHRHSRGASEVERPSRKRLHERTFEHDGEIWQLGLERRLNVALRKPELREPEAVHVRRGDGDVLVVRHRRETCPHVCLDRGRAALVSPRSVLTRTRATSTAPAAQADGDWVTTSSSVRQKCAPLPPSAPVHQPPRTAVEVVGRLRVG